MELMAGAMGSLIPKLKDLLEEYKLQTGVKDQVRSLELELEAVHAALCKVAEVAEVREASYDMEDILDTYLVRVDGSRKPNDDQDSLLKKMAGLFKKSKERHKIAGAIEKMRKNLQGVTDRRGRYTVDSIVVAKPAESSRTVDPRLTAMYREASDIIGIDKSSTDLISMLSPKGDDESNKKMKIVSVVGVGGLGKTTLANAIHDKLKSLFGCRAFVPVGQNPDLNKVFRDILIDLDKEKYTDLKYTMLDQRQLINELRDFLQSERYFVVIDDIWESKSWERIKLALVGNNCGSRIIITTRKFEVAKEADEVYRLQPLSNDNSKKLFYTRLFGGEDKCPTNHLDDLSNAILKKCGGVPLAIITMASLLLAEGFVEKKPRRGLFEVGEEYFHDLINRNLIQGVDCEIYGIMDGCRVHDMVLDLIVSISREENFVTTDDTLSQSHSRRLALKNRELDLTQDTHVNLPQVRSFILWRCAICKWALHPRFKLIRVLALEHCECREGDHSLEHIGNLLHLRYLGIQESRIKEFPEGIGALKFLQTLILKGYELELPCSIGRLTQLVCLCAPHSQVPDGVIGKLTSLEELQLKGPHYIDKSRRQFVNDLGNLCELRVLKTYLTVNMLECMHINFVQSLGNLKKMQHLKLGDSTGSVNMNTWDAAVPSGDLRCLFLPGVGFPKLPSWINSAHLPSLSYLNIHVDDMDEQGLKALGGLPELCYLHLATFSTATIVSSNTEADGCFQKLRSWKLTYSMVQFVANEDSRASFITVCKRWSPISRKKKDDCRVGPTIDMSNLEEIEFTVDVKEQNNVCCEDLGLEHLPSLRRVQVQFWCDGAFEDEVEREEAALRHAIEAHPNCPALEILYSGRYNMKWRSDDDDSVQPRNPIQP